MDIKLTETQEKHLPSIEWLISDERRVGKSTLLAVAFIKKALKNRGEWIYVFDHRLFQGYKSPGLVLDIIKDITYKDEDLRDKVKFRNSTFSFCVGCAQRHAAPHRGERVLEKEVR